MTPSWQKLIADHSRKPEKRSFRIPAYSEFMPAPVAGFNRYTGKYDPAVFHEDDPYGWYIPEIEQEFQLITGLQDISRQVMEHLVLLGRGLPEHHIRGHMGRNLINNPYWPDELAKMAGKLDHERFVILLPVALSKTQDDKGRIRWTLFGSSEQGPEKAFWKSFYEAPGKELPPGVFIDFIRQLLATAYGTETGDLQDPAIPGFRILPALPGTALPYTEPGLLPLVTKEFIIAPEDNFGDVRYLLTFNPFETLPGQVKEKYFRKELHLLPFPGSLVFWGMQPYLHNQETRSTAIQIPLLRLVKRDEGSYGIRVPQSGWLHEPKRDQTTSAITSELLMNTYHRTSRWDRFHRHEDPLTKDLKVHRMTDALFSVELDDLGLYNKPMARNCQLWSEDMELLLNGPEAGSEEIERAALRVLEGGLFLYRMQFPAMQTGNYEVYWQHPLVACLPKDNIEPLCMPEALTGFITAYPMGNHDRRDPVELWPRILRRDGFLSATTDFISRHDHHPHQTSLNLYTLLDTNAILGKPVHADKARAMIRIPRKETIAEWVDSIEKHTGSPAAAEKMKDTLRKIIAPDALPCDPLTLGQTLSRSYEENFWNDLVTLSLGKYINKDNADVVDDPVTLSETAHHSRDLNSLGNYLIRRHTKAIKEAGMEGKALVGELPFQWKTDFDFEDFGGWKANRDGRAYERDLLVIIPGKNRNEAVVMADHYDTAYMEDVYNKVKGGSGARLSSHGADDNHSATSTLLLAAPVFLKMAKEGKLERDIWLLHLTGEEFPADCLGARHFCECILNQTLAITLADKSQHDLSKTKITGVFVMDMIAHNREDAPYIFQISPGRPDGSLRLAFEAHSANRLWNSLAKTQNKLPPRKDRLPGKRSPDGISIPDIAMLPEMEGEIRVPMDPTSTLYNTDAQIFSDTGIPVVLFMEDYDISREGYHDTHDTLENIDLDYGAAFSAIAVETVARVASSLGK